MDHSVGFGSLSSPPDNSDFGLFVLPYSLSSESRVDAAIIYLPDKLYYIKQHASCHISLDSKIWLD